jgi:hypothetical protein
MRRETIPAVVALTMAGLFGVEGCGDTPAGTVGVSGLTDQPIEISSSPHVATPETRVGTLRLGETVTAICVINNKDNTPESVRVLTGIPGQIGYVAVFQDGQLQISPGTDGLENDLFACSLLDSAQAVQ